MSEGDGQFTNQEFELQNVKGTCDYLPAQMVLRNRVTAALKANFEKYGYLPLETATLCYLDLLSYKYAGGAEILKEVYKLSDQGNRELGLRYDMTVPFSKVIGMNQNLRMPFRRYEIGKVYRDGPVKLGRSREFYQCDVDVVGLDGQLVEAEFFKMAVDAFRELGIDVVIEYNNRKFLSGVIMASGIDEKYCSETILKVDMLKKHGEAFVREEIKKITVSADSEKRAVSDDSVDRLFIALNAPVEELVAHFDGAEGLVAEGLSELASLRAYLVGLGIDKNCVFVSSLARGLEIYTGTVWEVYDKELRLTSALGGGGRYDNIITKFMDNGTAYPAVGMSFGLEPICALLSRENEGGESPIDLYVVPMGTELASLKLADELRARGVRVLVDMTDSKLKKSLTYANNEHIKKVVVLGGNELEKGEFELKDMVDREKNRVFSTDALDELASYILGK